MELFNLEITRREKILNDKAEQLAKWEQEMADKVKECRKIEGFLIFLYLKKLIMNDFMNHKKVFQLGWHSYIARKKFSAKILNKSEISNV